MIEEAFGEIQENGWSKKERKKCVKKSLLGV